MAVSCSELKVLDGLMLVRLKNTVAELIVLTQLEHRLLEVTDAPLDSTPVQPYDWGGLCNTRDERL